MKWQMHGLLRVIHYRLIDILHRKPSGGVSTHVARVMWTIDTFIIDRVDGRWR